MTEALETTKLLRLEVLSVVETATVLAAKSVCSQVLAMVAEEAASTNIPLFANLAAVLPFYKERMEEVEAAWNEGRSIRVESADARYVLINA